MNKPYTKFWKRLCNTITANDVIVYCALKAYFAKSSNTTSKEEIFRNLLGKSFTPITNKNKLNCCKYPPFWAIHINFGYMLEIKYRKAENLGIWGTFDETVNKMFGGSEEEFQNFINFYNSLYIEVVRNKTLRPSTRRNYTYIFVDQNNVEPIYQAVQAAHVAMVIGQRMDKKFDASNIHYQICKMDMTYKDTLDNLTARGYKAELFYEPDVDRIIAIGTHPIPSHKRDEWIRSHELLTF